MNRRKPSNSSERDNSPSPPAASEDEPSVQPDGMPDRRWRTAISVWIPLHLFALLVSFAAVVEPSSLHASLQSLLRPYLQSTHFGADDRPLYFAYGDTSEQPHRLEISKRDIASADAEVLWTNPHFRSDQRQITFVSDLAGGPGLAVSDRYARWLSTAATLAENEQPSLVAELILPLVRQDESIRAIRITRLVTDLNSTIDEELPPPYIARVIRENDQVSLVQLQPERLAAISARESAGEDE